jgi:hypothetical protein
MFVLGIKYNLEMYICDFIIVVSELVDKSFLNMVVSDWNM